MYSSVRGQVVQSTRRFDSSTGIGICSFGLPTSQASSEAPQESAGFGGGAGE